MSAFTVITDATELVIRCRASFELEIAKRVVDATWRVGGTQLTDKQEREVSKATQQYMSHMSTLRQEATDLSRAYIERVSEITRRA